MEIVFCWYYFPRSSPGRGSRMFLYNAAGYCFLSAGLVIRRSLHGNFSFDRMIWAEHPGSHFIEKVSAIKQQAYRWFMHVSHVCLSCYRRMSLLLHNPWSPDIANYRQRLYITIVDIDFQSENDTAIVARHHALIWSVQQGWLGDRLWLDWLNHQKGQK